MLARIWAEGGAGGGALLDVVTAITPNPTVTQNPTVNSETSLIFMRAFFAVVEGNTSVDLVSIWWRLR